MSKIFINRSAKYQLAQKLSTHFKVKRALLSEDLDLAPDQPLASFPSINEVCNDFNETFYCTEVDKINLAELLYPDKFVKSQIWEAYLFGEGNASFEGLIMTMHTAGTLWMVYRSGKSRCNYDGIGGIVVYHKECGYMVCEPIKNWLNSNYPSEQE